MQNPAEKSGVANPLECEEVILMILSGLFLLLLLLLFRKKRTKLKIDIDF
jgi:LPXTG-motif cell wall-anchored protein